MSQKKNVVPKRWLNYQPMGQRLPGTRFIAFKVPLKESLNRRVPQLESFDLWDLMDCMESGNQELGLIIDLTFTTKYYSLTDVPQSCSYIKISTEGHRVPSDNVILSFKQAVRSFLRENWDNDKLIGVHCTHGLNRTGYLVCRYLIDVDGLDPSTAVQLFNSSRGHSIERKNYLRDLQNTNKRSNGAIDESKKVAMKGLAVLRRPSVAREGGEKLRATTEEPQQRGDVPTETEQPDCEQPSGYQRKRRARRRAKVNRKHSHDGLLGKPDIQPEDRQQTS
ncbi:RNA/RNP complex-1-interacting phosphatase-like [Cololabis saira]|uniref:RNA/RNP complex-1-interacting phosphatase-like n=1 Tax=Cololabis saira TaxID=129043 RepID=UPI002AD2543A|nr:RNA/RNP complex-1-interacting phosphatase-like [Cololabis saira]